MAIRPMARTDVNRSAILAHLGAHGPASRAELARTLSLSPALMTQLTKDLLHDGLLRELEHQASQGGRPARMLGLVSSAGRAVGVKVASDHVAFVEVGIDGTVLRTASEPFDAAATTMLMSLAGLLRSFIAGGSSAPLLGIGVGVPGSVDSQAAGVVSSTQLKWNNVPIGATLRRELGLPVLVENNVNALAMAERLYGLGRRHRNFLAVTIGTGIGAAIVIDGLIVRGFGGGAGEIGHIPVREDGPRCTCGNIGCLETFVSESALVATARDRNVIAPGAGVAALRDAADRGNPAAIAVFGEAGHLLGRAIAGLVHVLDPEVVILLGEGTADWGHWSYGFEPAFRAALIPARRGIPVAVETWQDASWAQGAATLVLATPFDAEGIAGEQGDLVRQRLVQQASPQERS
ncbi:ROK family protein [Salinibacterium sp. SWN139]|uniref:ROK family transcriptional regulator n=1 Tax=Salinibacterium sp. SWN139 TaxID=2792055 RepID=UPI0018CE9B55|nr:ROK family transcriptional regulator [Salinibacterium sp. SWN139]MBH0053903.1 ROK family protein [Salinibacterium sp. SWN139]